MDFVFSTHLGKQACNLHNLLSMLSSYDLEVREAPGEKGNMHLFYGLLSQKSHLQGVGLYCLPWHMLAWWVSQLLSIRRKNWSVGLRAVILKVD